MKYLLIVESPNKIKTLENILKNEKDDYKIIASAGHILELDNESGTDNMGFDIDNNFNPHYVNIKDKSKIISNIKKTYKEYKPDKVLLGGDIDFEGTFINWSIKHILKLSDDDYRTVEFIALTKEDVLKALKQNTKINENHLKAQQTRAILDKLCGFTLSPRLYKALGNNLSAGRVQSIVVKLIIDKENEINEFMNNEENNYYSINGKFNINDNIIDGVYNNNKLNKINKTLLNKFQKNPYYIKNKEYDTKEIKPPKPFNTPTLQQEINKRFGISSKNSMKILQSLFEKGYITYHRTTSITLSKECKNMCKEFILNKYGEEYYEERDYKDKSDNSENSHEAIRHTKNNNNLNVLSDLEKKIYLLIMNNTLKSQMKNKIVEEIIIEYNNNKLDDNFKSIIKYTKFKGFSIINNNDKDDDKDKELYDIIDKLDEDKENELIMENINCIEKYNNPPARYTEATLINKLSPKNLNIGRPSTYASIIDKIQKREYVKIDDIKGKPKDTINYIITPNEIKKEKSVFNIGEEHKKFIPTELGIKINDLLNKNCKNIMDYHFTADLENKLDLIASKATTKDKVLNDFYKEFKEELNELDKDINKMKKGNVIGQKNDKDITLKHGKYGRYINWNSKNYKFDESLEINEENINKVINGEDKKTIKYKGKDIEIKEGKFGLYFTYNKKNYSLKDYNKDDITKDIIDEIINKKNSNILKKIGKYEIINGPYGAYFKSGKRNISLSGKNIDELTEEDLKELIDKPITKKKYYKKK